MIKKIGIIILNYNTSKETMECIESIEKFTNIDYQIYIVDNCSTDNSWFELSGKYKNSNKINLIKSTTNSGYSAGNNLGVTEAIRDNCEILFIMNSDVILLNNAIEVMCDTLERSTDYIVVGPSILDNKKVESQIAKKKLTFKNFVYGRHPFCSMPYFKKKVDREYEFETCNKNGKFEFDGMVSGCCFGIRSTDFECLGFFDENVFLYYEEDIFIYKLSEIKKKSVIDLHAKIWHKESVSTKKSGNAFIRYHRWCSATYLMVAYAKIGVGKKIVIFLWNSITWILLSVKSNEYRKLLKSFLDRQGSILMVKSKK